MVLQRNAKTHAERERATIVLRSAADLGLAHAQFEIGRRLEQGLDGQPQDVEAAMPWYRKAAAQGDVFAIQRIEQGILPDVTPTSASTYAVPHCDGAWPGRQRQLARSPGSIPVRRTQRE